MSAHSKKAIIFSKNKKLCRLIEIELMLASYTVSVQRSPETRVSRKTADRYDCVILDATDSKSTLFPALPKAPLKIAVIDESTDNIPESFEHVLEYPFPLDELRALLMRDPTQKADSEDARTEFQKCFYLDSSTKAKSVIFNNTIVSLSDYELRVLTLLCENAGKCVSREEISEALGAEDGNIAEVYICHLRRKLEAPFGIKVIHTVRGKGYYTDYVILS